MDLKKTFSYMQEFLNNPKCMEKLQHQTAFRRQLEQSEDKLDVFITFFLDSLVSHKYIPEIPLHTGAETCSYCGKKIMTIFNGEEFIDGEWNPEYFFDTLQIKPLDCKNPSDFSFDITFPTGEVVITDGLRFKDAIRGKILGQNPMPLNSHEGVKVRTLLNAKYNIFHVYLGNTSPTVYKAKEGLVIAKEDYYEDVDIQIKGLSELTYICTDLWWGTVVDLQTIRGLLGVEDIAKFLEPYRDSIFKIEPGTYKVTYTINPDLNDIDSMPYKTITLTRI